MSDSLSHLLRLVASECKEERLEFAIFSYWDSPSFDADSEYTFQWQIESGREDEFGSGESHKTLDDCLYDCVEHINMIKERRNA